MGRPHASEVPVLPGSPSFLLIAGLFACTGAPPSEAPGPEGTPAPRAQVPPDTADTPQARAEALIPAAGAGSPGRHHGRLRYLDRPSCFCGLGSKPLTPVTMMLNKKIRHPFPWYWLGKAGKHSRLASIRAVLREQDMLSTITPMERHWLDRLEKAIPSLNH